MSFDQLSSMESQPTMMRRGDAYQDDPEFSRLSQDLSTRLFTLTGNISRLSNQIALLGTRRDSERVRERVHDLLEETKDAFKEVGDGVKKIQSWDNVSVCHDLAAVHRANMVSPRRSTRSRSCRGSSKPP
jgi:hypothetical protein